MDIHLDLDIYMNSNGVATVSIKNTEGCDQTSFNYDTALVLHGDFDQWLINEVTSWISLMADMVEEEGE